MDAPTTVLVRLPPEISDALEMRTHRLIRLNRTRKASSEEIHAAYKRISVSSLVHLAVYCGFAMLKNMDDARVLSDIRLRGVPRGRPGRG